MIWTVKAKIIRKNVVAFCTIFTCIWPKRRRAARPLSQILVGWSGTTSIIEHGEGQLAAEDGNLASIIIIIKTALPQRGAVTPILQAVLRWGPPQGITNCGVWASRRAHPSGGKFNFRDGMYDTECHLDAHFLDSVLSTSCHEGFRCPRKHKLHSNIQQLFMLMQKWWKTVDGAWFQFFLPIGHPTNIATCHHLLYRITPFFLITNSVNTKAISWISCILRNSAETSGLWTTSCTTATLPVAIRAIWLDLKAYYPTVDKPSLSLEKWPYTLKFAPEKVDQATIPLGSLSTLEGWGALRKCLT